MFSEAIVLLFVIELLRFHILIIDSIFNMFIMVLGDDFLFYMSWADALWSRCGICSLDACGIMFLNSFCAAWILCLVSFIVVQVVSIIGVTFTCNFCTCFCWLYPVLSWTKIAFHIVTFLITRWSAGDHGWLWCWVWMLFSVFSMLVVMSASIWLSSFSSLLFNLLIFTIL